MKKIMIAIAAVATAVCAEAAAVTWSSGAVKDHNGSLLESSTLYKATVYFFSDPEGTENVSATFGGTLSKTTADKSGIYSANTGSTGIESGTYYAKLVIEGKAGTAAEGWTLTSDIGQFTYSSTDQSKLTINFKSGQNMGGSDLLHNTGKNFGWQSVPEPTSGLLLLLGVAGLALRRRRA